MKAKKRCSKCKQFKQLSDFRKNRSKKDGLQCYCKLCRKVLDNKYRNSTKGKATIKRYSQSEKGLNIHKIANKRYRQSKEGKVAHKCHRQTEKYKATRNRYLTRHPEYRKARNAVNNAIIAGKLPHPTTLRCHCCPAQAQQYHHYKGYAPEYWLDVVPVCKKCHYKCNKKIA